MKRLSFFFKLSLFARRRIYTLKIFFNSCEDILNTPKPSIIKTFAPGWFAAVMGTAVISIAVFSFQAVLPFATALQMFFLFTALLFFVLAIVPWVLRWFLHFDDACRDINHPVSAAFFPTMPISLLVIGIALE